MTQWGVFGEQYIKTQRGSSEPTDWFHWINNRAAGHNIESLAKGLWSQHWHITFYYEMYLWKKWGYHVKTKLVRNGSVLPGCKALKTTRYHAIPMLCKLHQIYRGIKKRQKQLLWTSTMNHEFRSSVNTSYATVSSVVNGQSILKVWRNSKLRMRITYK